MLDSIHHIVETSSGIFALIGELISRLSIFGEVDQAWWELVQSWQTLIAGMIAFIPASLAAVFVWRQVNEQRNQFLRVQEAVATKARLKLSRNLSHISHHLDECYLKLISEDFSYASHSLPENLVDDILDAAVSARGQNFLFFQSYVEKIQTYASLCGICADSRSEERLVACFRSLAELDALTDSLYPFARYEIEKVDEHTVGLPEIKFRLEHNLRRGRNISGSNLEKILSLNHFDD